MDEVVGKIDFDPGAYFRLTWEIATLKEENRLLKEALDEAQVMLTELEGLPLHQ